jgi:ribosomal protein L10
MIRKEKELYLARTLEQIGSVEKYMEFGIISCELSVESEMELRKLAKAEGICVKKIPNRLLMIIFKKFNIKLPREKLGGQNILLYCNSSFNISSFLRKLEEQKIKHKPLYLLDGSGSIDFAGGARVETREEILGGILGAIQTPTANLIHTFQQIIEQGLVK